MRGPFIIISRNFEMFCRIILEIPSQMLLALGDGNDRPFMVTNNHSLCTIFSDFCLLIVYFLYVS